MESFGENFRGGRSSVSCPFCENHNDNQYDAFYNCDYIQQLIETEGQYEDIFGDTIPKKVIKTLSKITNIRKQWSHIEELTPCALEDWLSDFYVAAMDK